MRKVRTTIGIVIDTLGSLIIYALIAGAILFMIGQAKHYYDFGYGLFSQQGKDARGTGKVVMFTVEEGMTASKIGEKLEEEGIVESARLFVIQEKVSDYSGMYVPGSYVLSSEMTTEEIMRVISGTEPSPYTLPEEEAARKKHLRMVVSPMRTPTVASRETSSGPSWAMSCSPASTG